MVPNHQVPTSLVSTYDAIDERSILYLHFLNREPFRSVNTEPSPSATESALRILAASTMLPLYSNYSNLFEGVLSPASGTLLGELLKHQHVRIVGERASVDEFVASREARYAFDRDRYPMYFSGDRHLVTGQPHLVKENSSTRYIEQGIRDFASPDSHRIAPRQADHSLLFPLLPTLVRDTLNSRDRQALTLSLFLDAVQDPQQRFAIARMLSALYIKHYMEELQADVCTGFVGLTVFDDLAQSYPRFHLPALERLLQVSGLDLARLGSAIDRLLPRLRGSSTHYQFCQEVQLVLETFTMLARGPAALDATLLEFNSTAPRGRAVRVGPSLYEAALQHLLRAVRVTTAKHAAFASAYGHAKSRVDRRGTVLIVTATNVETRAFKAATEAMFGSTSPRYIQRDCYVAREYRDINELKIVHVQCEAGSSGQSSAQAVITDAIRDFGPANIIMTGIAFGLKPEKQRLGDLLVSTIVVDYERARRMDTQTLPRGARTEASPKLLSVFRAAYNDGLAPREAYFGPVVSGEKLVDSEEFVKSLRAREPEAIGGEMEGAGLVAAAQRERAAWILVKAIVDWGFRKAENNSLQSQYDAALDAHKFVLGTLREVGV